MEQSDNLEEGRSLPEPEIERGVGPDRIMAVDLSSDDELVTYPANRDWPLERKKILFLQTAIKLKVGWLYVVNMTGPFFGSLLESPPVLLVQLVEAKEPFRPPGYDIERQTPQDWAAAADKEWNRHRDNFVRQISERRSNLIEQGAIKEFERHRKNSGTGGQDKAPIADEDKVFRWAVGYYLLLFSWTDLARIYAESIPANPLEASQQRRRRADHIRKRVVPLLKELGLPWK